MPQLKYRKSPTKLEGVEMLKNQALLTDQIWRWHWHVAAPTTCAHALLSEVWSQKYIGGNEYGAFDYFADSTIEPRTS